MNNKQCLGRLGEDISVIFLEENGYRVLERNYRCRYGEIDIIAVKDKTVVFIEVKTRRSINYGYPVEAITKIKMKHMYNSSTYYLLNSNLSSDMDVRIDAVEVYVQWPTIKVNHIKGIIMNQVK